MKTKLLRKLRNRFQILKQDNLYFVADWKGLNEYNNPPYQYLSSTNLKEIQQQRRELKLSTFERKTRFVKQVIISAKNKIMKEIRITHKVKQFGVDNVETGEYMEYKDVIYKFLGYEYGTYPIGENIETGKTVTLPHY